jgi:hypothetical protein
MYAILKCCSVENYDYPYFEVLNRRTCGINVKGFSSALRLSVIFSSLSSWIKSNRCVICLDNSEMVVFVSS